MKFYATKRNDGVLIPCSDEDADYFRQISTGDVVKCSIPDQRNLQHHKKFFSLIRVVYDNLPERYDRHFPTPDDLRYELIKRAGFYKQYTDLKGNTQYIAESIAFDKMSQKRFTELYDRVLDVVIQWFEWDREVLELEIMQYA